MLIGAPVVEGVGSLVADGGNGGDALGDISSTWGWSGGGGGGGRVKLYGTTDGFTGTSQATGGAGGAIPPDESSYAGLPGEDGTVDGSAAVPPEFGELICV